MIRYTYRLTDYRSILRGFARLFGLKIKEKKLIVPPQLGSGYAYASNISEDISYAILNCSFKDDLQLIRRPTRDYGLVLIFNQTEISDYLKIAEDNKSVIEKTPNLHNIYLASTNTDLEMRYSKGSHIRLVVVFFSPALVKKSIRKDILLNLKLYTDGGLDNLNREPITFEYRSLLDDIFSADTSSPIANLVLQNRILMLTEKFLTDFLEKGSKPHEGRLGRIKEKDLAALREVEELLSKHDLDKFPSIDVLSKTAMMSSTKLKTKFKSVYGMKLYEYYNRNRLEKAREMLQTGKYSVKQVGLEIGFTNLSNFAKAFKKEFGVLPNEMLRIRQ